MVMPLTQFSETERELILKMLAEAETWKRIAAVVDCSIQTLQGYILRDAEFSKQCELARVLGAEVQADSLNTILEEYPNVYEAKLISDNRKWTLSKRFPKSYGDKLDLNINAKVNMAGVLADMRAVKLPPRDLEGIEDAELVDNTQQLLNGTTDATSVDLVKSNVDEMLE